jgi:hypothetical protein
MKVSIYFAYLISIISVLTGACSSNKAPVFYPIPNQIFYVGQHNEFDITAVDDDSESLIIQCAEKPSGAYFEQTDHKIAKFSWSPLASDAVDDAYEVVFTVTDGSSHSSTTALITVLIDGTGENAPTFTSADNFVLNIEEKSFVKFYIEVKDPDTSEVDLVLEKEIEGAKFQTSPGSLVAAFSWTPTAAQIAEKQVWAIQVSADDHTNPKVYQDITIRLEGSQNDCKTATPILKHTELSDQRISGNYVIEALASDNDSEIKYTHLYYEIKTGGGGDSEQKVQMTANNEMYTAEIPNPNLQGDQTATVVYWICTTDNDDAEGTECDLQTCIPKDGKFTFTAYAPDNSACEDDKKEPNNNTEQATRLEKSDWLFVSGLKICPNDVDWYVLTVPANFYFDIFALYTPENGVLNMQVYADDGTTLIASGELDEFSAYYESELITTETTFYFLIYGENGISNSYDLALDMIEAPDISQIQEVTEGSYPDQQINNVSNFYKIDLQAETTLTVSLEFLHANGDLDLYIYSDESFDVQYLIAASDSTDDYEQAVANISFAGTYYIAVVPYGQEVYTSYTMTISISDGCFDDANEDNDNPQSAADLNTVSTIEANIVCSSDEDWYKIDLTSGQTLRVNAIFDHINGDLDVLLHDAEILNATSPSEYDLYDALVYGDSETDDEYITFLCIEDGTYYVRVYSYSGTEENVYTLDWWLE